MKKIDKVSLITFVAVALVLVSLMAVGTVYDLQISVALCSLKPGHYYATTIFGRVFETIGEMPFYLITAFASAILFHNMSRRTSSIITWIFKIIAIVASVAMLYYLSYKFFKYLSQHFGFTDLLGDVWDYVSYAILGVCFTVILFYLTRKLPSSFLNKALIWVAVVVVTAIISQIATRVLKSMAARPRFRAMFVLQDFSMFKNWFDFQGKAPELTDDWQIIYGATSDWFKSFPSGHTSAGSLVVTLTFMPFLFTSTNNAKSKIITNVCVFLYIALVMLNRLVVGAHFITDVTFGLFLTLISYLIALAIVKVIFNKIKIQPLDENKVPKIVEEIEG